MSTDVVIRESHGLDLSIPPWERWHPGMVKLVRSVTGLKKATDPEVYYCLALAESLQLNPMANEIYFLERRAKDGNPAGVTPYVGRDGLVTVATRRRAWFEPETVREHDDFRVIRRRNGTRTVEHDYGHHRDRGEIVGAWALLHFKDGTPSAFAYAPLEEYLPHFDQAWKMERSPWGNQRSAMIQKCAMIVAGRQRLPLGGILIDAELDRVELQRQAGGVMAEADARFDWDALDAPPEVIARLRAAVEAVNAAAPLSWTPAKCEMVLRGRPVDELIRVAGGIEAEASLLAGSRDSAPVVPPPGAVGDPAPDPTQSTSEVHAPVDEPTDAEIVDEESQRVLELRIVDIERRLQEQPEGSEAWNDLSDELDRLTAELEAGRSSAQKRLL